MRCTTSTTFRCEPHQLRATADEIADAEVSADVDQAIDDAIAHLRAFNEQLMRRARRLELRERAGPLRRREDHADQLGRVCSYRAARPAIPSVAYQLACRQPSQVCPNSHSSFRRCPTGGGQIDPAVLVVCRKLGIDNVFRVNGPAGVAALGFGTESIPQVRKIVGPGSPPVACAQVEMQRYGVATMMILGPTESLVHRRRLGGPAIRRRRSVERGRARHRLDGAPGHRVRRTARRGRPRAGASTRRLCPRHAPRQRAARSGATVDV